LFILSNFHIQHCCGYTLISHDQFYDDLETNKYFSSKYTNSISGSISCNGRIDIDVLIVVDVAVDNAVVVMVILLLKLLILQKRCPVDVPIHPINILEISD